MAHPVSLFRVGAEQVSASVRACCLCASAGVSGSCARTCGFNPEGNVERKASKSSLETAFELSAEPELPWLSKSEVRAA
eukprot:15448345-Alexandrium_andersonii.AAC.1